MEVAIQNPLMLLLLLIVPILIFLHYYFFEHNRRRAMKFSNFSAMKRVTGTTLITKNTGQLILRCGTIIFLILASAGISVWTEGEASTSDYVIAVDTSASMVSEDVLPDRLTLAKQSADGFIDSLKAYTNIGILSFSGVSLIKTPMTDDPATAKAAIDKLDIELAGGTDIGNALITATNMLSQAKMGKSIILVTDGSDTAGTFVDENIENALAYVGENHVIVHTIGIGTGLATAGYLENSQLRAVYDKDTLKNIADLTGGKFYEVKSSADFASAFRDIGGLKQKAEIPHEISGVLYACGLLLLLAEWGLLNTRFRALP